MKSVSLLMFGMTEEEVEKEFLCTREEDNPYDRLNFAMMILSDAQESMSIGDPDTARRFINKAKYHIQVAKDQIRRKEEK